MSASSGDDGPPVWDSSPRRPVVHCPKDGVVCWYTDEGPTCGFCGWPHRERELPAESAQLVGNPMAAGEAQHAAVAESRASPVHSLRLVPSRLDFGVLAADTSAEREVQVRSQTGQNIDVGVNGTFPSWLVVERERRGKVRIRVDAGQWKGQSKERFEAMIKLECPNTAATATLPVLVQFCVPSIQCSPAAVRFPRVRGKRIQAAPLTIRNTAEGELVLKEIVLDHKWLKVDIVPLVDSSEVELRFIADVKAAGAGQHQAEVHIVSNDRAQPVVAIPVLLHVDA